MTKKLNLTIRQGETFQKVIRWETLPIVYKAISVITQAAPAVLTIPLHGLPTGWRATVVSANGMEEINAVNTPPRDKDYHQVTVKDAFTIELNDVNAAEYTAYSGGGFLQFYTPVSLAGVTAKMEIKDKVGGTILMTLTNGVPDNRIALNTSEHTITLTISATDTAAITWTKGVYDLEMTNASVVTTIFSGKVSVIKEVTT